MKNKLCGEYFFSFEFNDEAPEKIPSSYKQFCIDSVNFPFYKDIDCVTER